MRYPLFVIVLLVLVCCAQAAVAQGTPVVTIDANKNFCINGEPTYILGTMGGDDYAWQTHLGPAGFNVRFLGSTTRPGAHSAGLWEAPDVVSDPSLVSTMKDNPNVLTWTLGYQIDSTLRDDHNWPGHTSVDLVNKMEQCRSLDNDPARPVGVIWGNDTTHDGYEFWGRDGYWHSTRQYEQLCDYFVAGDINVIEDQTIANAVRLSNKPVIAMFKCVPGSDNPFYFQTPEYLTQNLWTAVVTGAKGIIIDRYETPEGYTWIQHIDVAYFNTIKKNISEIKELTPALTAPGPWIYYKNIPNEVPDYQCLLWTHRMVGNDMYVIATSMWRMFPISDNIMAPIIQSDAKGEVLFDHLTTGVLTHPATSTTITDASKNWTPNQFAGDRLWIKHGSPAHKHKYTIASNTANTITIEGGDLLADGAQRFDYYYVNEMVGRTFYCYLPEGGRKVVKYENVNTYVTIPKAAEAVAKPSDRRWVELMDWSDQFPGQKWEADGYGLAYDTNRHRLVCQGGVNYFIYPDGKPNVYDPDVWFSHYVCEWDLDNNYYSGLLDNTNSAAGDGWPGGSRWSDLVYNPQRQTCMTFEEDGSVWEWHGKDQGWTKIPASSPRMDPGEMTHFAAIYSPAAQGFLTYGGKDGNHPGMNGRGMQFIYEWCNQLWGFNGTEWYNYNNPDVNLPYGALEEPQMVWDSSRGSAVLFGCSHEGFRSKDKDPIKCYQQVPQQTWEINSAMGINMRNTAHVPYVFANYRMVFDPRSSTTLLFGGLPSKNGKITDLYEYNGSDWSRLDYNDASLPAQDVRRTPNLVWDPDHQMVLFLDTRQQKIWGLTSGTETTVGSIDEARAQSLGTSLVLEGMYVSRVFGGYFYMQDAARTTGIRVVSTTAPAIGQKVNVIGTLMQTASGEKYLQATTVGQTGSGAVEPVAMANSAVAGKATATRPGADDAWGANNTGVLVKVWGRVSYADASCAYIDDGSGITDASGRKGIKVQLNGVAAPAVGEYVAVTGISATEKIGTSTARVVLLSRAEDLTNY